ncbi:hypothetical protein [Cupriavidus sp. H19C3]|uniref:hypothetical protein n=1 Tax=Cupriavidus sp. H19C3 TaxID=3241603 RepID=UPI0029353DC7|nr:hypothetical protein [Raoultella ornithinolytica]
MTDKIVMAKISKSFVDEAKKRGISVNDYLWSLKADSENRELQVEKVKLEKVMQLPGIIDSLIEMRKADRRYLDEIEREHRKDRESVSALTKAVSNLIELFIKAITRRG